MYYKEKLIDGVLMCRFTPNGDWRQCSVEDMSRRIINLQNTIENLRKSK